MTSARIGSKRCSGSLNPCAQCSLIIVIRYRFSAFSAKFGREPMPAEPLFFDPSESAPVKASLSEAREQIEEAAAARGINAGPVIRLLKLDPAIPQQEADRTGHNRGQVIADRGTSKRTGNHHNNRKSISVWERFATNERLQRLHGITRQELKAIFSVTMMGEVRNSGDLLQILGRIREASQSAGAEKTVGLTKAGR